jgi:uncharacterized membrane protein
MAEKNALEKIVELDEQREGFPGEHWIVLAAGIAAWWLTRKHPSMVVRTLGTLAGTALVARAATGREGLSNVLRYTPVGSGIRRAAREAKRDVQEAKRAALH